MDYGGFKLDEYAPELAKSGISVLWNQLKFLWKGTRIWFLGLRKPPYEESRARQIAHAILAGHIVRAISYRNLDFPNILIAVIRRSSEQDYDATAHVLEQTGKTFRVLWQTARLFGPDAADLAVEDVDGDGHHEVIIELRSTGTGAGSRILMVYSTRKKQ